MKRLNQEIVKEDFWDDTEKAQETMQEYNDVKELIEEFEKLAEKVEDQRTFLDLFSDEELALEKDAFEKELINNQKTIRSLTTKTLLSGEYDANNCYFSIHAGSGGTEAMDWAGMLQRMYERWFSSKNFKVSLTDINKEETGGIKSCSFEVRGKNAYGLCKGEKGVHRLVRISPFDSQSRRHTSFSSVDVYPEIPDTSKIELNENDLKIDTYRSTGAGGQHVNTTDSAVRITHIPTGIVVTCQNERSQIQNRMKARDMLIAKLVQIKEEEHREKIDDIQGKYTQISWGAQIRSYVFQPYTMVKDHRTGEETGNVEKVMDGDLDPFVESYLVWKASEGAHAG